eukprot:GHVS01023499.1.p1 GENE.GHVS01023499.1~~GHVS01023499.1.p1  ORF type:complete len:334 (-),score=20.75 GHVS01023499.1:285-1259(-)
MANLVIGKMKLLAAGPPLLFLALLYSLSFIDICFSAPQPGDVELDMKYMREDVQIQSVGLKETDLIAAGEFLKNSKSLRNRLVDVAMLYWSVLSPACFYGPTQEPRWLDVKEFKHGLETYAIQAVKAMLADNFKHMISSVEFQGPCELFVKLKCAEEEMVLEYPWAWFQILASRYRQYQDAIFNRDGHDCNYLHSSERVLPFVHALGDKPEVVSNPLSYYQRDVVRIKVAEMSDTNVCIHVNDNGDRVTLERQGAVTISTTNEDGKNEEMVKFGISYDKSVCRYFPCVVPSLWLCVHSTRLLSTRSTSLRTVSGLILREAGGGL